MSGLEAPLEPRLKWISDRVCALLKAKPELFEKIYVTEEGETLLKRFINDDSCTRIFFLGGAKEMTCSEAFPQAGKKKVVFCQKTKECKLDEKSMDNVFDQCVVGDINAPLLQAMQGMLGSVYLPILSNAENTKGWPEVAMKAFTDVYQRMLNAVEVAIGQTNGQTKLAVPAMEKGSGSKPGGGGERQDKDRVHVLESAVVMWTERINNALSRHPEAVFANNQHPGCAPPHSVATSPCSRPRLWARPSCPGRCGRGLWRPPGSLAARCASPRCPIHPRTNFY